MSRRVQVRSSGSLLVQPSPLTETSGTTVDLTVRDGWQYGEWERSSVHDQVSGVAYVSLNVLAAGITAKLFALRVKVGPAIRVRITSQASGVAVIPVGSSLLLTFPTDDLLTLVEVSGDADEVTDIVWCAVA